MRYPRNNKKKSFSFTKKAKHFLLMLISAWMIGISNVIYDRMVNDTKKMVEQRDETLKEK
ncbi:hypothetical protein GTQ40_06345 [Flavobacteriaceae bacterium R38]|nr:hypothetical protein [Flavobacteriaceae bacterium R38]